MVQFGTFKVPGAKNGPKNAKIGQKRPKMGMDKWPFFEKNIPSDLAKIGPKYHFWTNNYDNKGFGAHIHEKFFRVAKLRFVAQLNNPLAEIDQRARSRSGRVQVALKDFSHV